MKKILIDENLPRRLEIDFTDDDYNAIAISTQGWTGKKDKEMLELMVENKFDILLTADKSLQYEQNLDKYNIQILVVRTHNSRYAILKEFVDIIKKELNSFTSTEKVKEIDLRK